MEWILKRAKERSTWMGIMTLAGVLGYSVRPDLQEQIVTAITAVAGIIFTVTSDKKRVEVINAPTTITDPDDEKRAA